MSGLTATSTRSPSPKPRRVRMGAGIVTRPRLSMLRVRRMYSSDITITKGLLDDLPEEALIWGAFIDALPRRGMHTEDFPFLEEV